MTPRSASDAGPLPRIRPPLRAALAVAIAALPTLATAAVTVTKDGDDFTVSTGVYQARIDGKTGLLATMTIDGTKAIEGMGIDLANVGDMCQQVVTQDGAKVVAFISAKGKDKVLERALRITYEPEEASLNVLVFASQGGGAGIAGRGPDFAIGHDAQMVRSLEFKETVPMPALQGCGPWSRVKFHYANGATLGIINTGPGNPFNPNENGGVGQFRYSRGGYVANGEYGYSLIAEKGGAKSIGSPAMTIKQSSTTGVFWHGDPIVADIAIAKSDYAKIVGRPGLKIRYEIEDTSGSISAKGDQPLDLSGGADPVQVAVPIALTKLGWFRGYFWVDDAAGDLLPGKQRLIFSVLERQPNMGERFDHQIQTDYAIGLGMIRGSIEPTRIDDITRMVDDYVKAAAGTDVNVSYQIDASPVGNDPVKFGEVCFKLFDAVKERIPQIEIINEPNGTLQPKEYINSFLRPAFENIRKASPKTKVLGPVLCGIGPDQARYLDELYRLGLKDLTDELTFHPYAGNFDDGNATESMQGLMSVIAAHGDSGKPIHFTEAGYSHGGWSNLPALQEVVKNAVSQYVWQNAVMGIDHRHNFYYFTDSMGYYDMWLRSGQLTPGAVALRTYTATVKGQDRPSRLDFGSLDVLRAFKYPGKERQVVVLWTACNGVPAGQPDPTTTASFVVDGAVECLDCYGNPLPVSAKDGTLTLEVGSYPMYLIAPAKAKLEPVAERWGTNVALTALGATAEASSEQGTGAAVSVIDGNTASDPAWRSMTPNELPQSVTVTLSGPTTIDRVGIWGYSPRGYDVEVMGADGAWAKVATKRDQPYRRFRTDTFKPVLTDQVRLTVVDAFAEYSNVVQIAELQVFSPGAGAAGAAMDLVNWAQASEGATAKASSEMKKEVSVAEMEWGAKTPKVNKILLEGKAANAIDGKRMIGNWREFYPTTWVADPKATGPQWLEIDFPGPRKISTVTVYTVAFANWTPANSGIRDWDVQVWDGKDWKTVDSVHGNQRVSQISRLKGGATTDRIRIVVTGTNSALGTIGIMEVQAYGPRQ